jgi:uncharacterized membrane protein YgdD (TMEM256/DUF423 family)
LTGVGTPATLARMRLGVVGALAGAVAVAAGAFGAHGLRDRLDAASLATFETAARYQLVHALALIVAAQRAAQRPGRAASLAGGLFVAGMLLFSGSLYALALGSPRIVGLITPFGGLSFIAGWLALAASFLAG